MTESQITWNGPPADDNELLQLLPSSVRAVLRNGSGYMLRSGLHVRGVCHGAPWHSLRHAFQGEHAFHRLYRAVKDTDIPFAENCIGDQFFVRENVVWFLDAETGEMNETVFDAHAFIEQANLPNATLLATNILEQFHRESGDLQPGKLIHAYPPLCSREADHSVSLRAISTCELHEFHADFARQIANVPDGARI